MKHSQAILSTISLRLLTWVGFFVLCFGQAQGQRDVNNWQLSGYIGTAVLSDNVNLPDGFQAYSSGFLIERNMGDAWAIGVQMLHVELEPGLGRLTYSGLSLAYFWDNGQLLNDRAAVAPFHRIQIGYGHEYGSPTSFARNGNTFGLENGVKFRLGNRLSADLALLLLAPREDLLSSEFFGQTNYSIWKAGITFHFGSRKSTYQGPVFRASASHGPIEFGPEAFSKATTTPMPPLDPAGTSEEIQYRKGNDLSGQEQRQGNTGEIDSKSAERTATSNAIERANQTSIEERTEISSFSEQDQIAAAASPGEPRSTTNNTTVLPPAVVTNTREVQDPDLKRQNDQLKTQNALLLAGGVAAGAALASGGSDEGAAGVNTAREDSLSRALAKLQEQYDLLLLNLAQNKLDSLFENVESDWKNPNIGQVVVVSTSIDTAGLRSDSTSVTITSSPLLPADADSILQDPHANSINSKEPLLKGTYPGVVNFRLNSREVDQVHRAALKRIGQDLADQPTMTVLLSAHSDKSGNPVYNKQISEDRARAVEAVILLEGARSAQVKLKIYGAEEATATFSPESRRVEITLIEP